MMKTLMRARVLLVVATVAVAAATPLPPAEAATGCATTWSGSGSCTAPVPLQGARVTLTATASPAGGVAVLDATIACCHPADPLGTALGDTEISSSCSRASASTVTCSMQMIVPPLTGTAALSPVVCSASGTSGTLRCDVEPLDEVVLGIVEDL